MLKLNFSINGSPVVAKIDGKKIYFSGQALGLSSFIPMEKLMLMGGTSGILKEWPELKYLPQHEMKNEAVKRFRAKVEAMGSEEEIKGYVVGEMRKQGALLI